MFAHSCRRLVVPLVVAFSAGERAYSLPLPLHSSADLDQQAVRSVYVRGSVLDDGTGAPVADARVTIGGTRFTSVTAADGRFQFEDVPRGEYELLVAHLGYVSVPASLTIGTDALDIVVRLGPVAIPLEPIRVTAFSRRLETVGFYDRQRRGVGTFMGRERIDAMRAHNSSELLRNIPGVRLTPQPTTRAQAGLGLQGRGRCRYSFIVDGARTLPDFEMDMVAPYAIEGLEFYRSLAELPAPFRVHVGREGNATSCGIVVIWTRDRH